MFIVKTFTLYVILTLLVLNIYGANADKLLSFKDPSVEQENNLRGLVDSSRSLATATGWVTASYYSSYSCSGSIKYYISFATGVCFKSKSSSYPSFKYVLSSCKCIYPNNFFITNSHPILSFFS